MDGYKDQEDYFLILSNSHGDPVYVLAQKHERLDWVNLNVSIQLIVTQADIHHCLLFS